MPARRGGACEVRRASIGRGGLRFVAPAGAPCGGLAGARHRRRVRRVAQEERECRLPKDAGMSGRIWLATLDYA